MKPQYTSTIEEFKDCSDTISYSNLSLFEKINKIDSMTSYNLINEYLEDLEDLTINVKFSDEEYYRYLYKPKLLAYDIYGSTELFFIITALNNICSCKEFDFKTVKMLKIETLNQVLSWIYNSEHDTLINNRNKK